MVWELCDVDYSTRLDGHRLDRTSPTVHPGVLRDPHLECAVEVAVKRIYVGHSAAEKAKVAQEAMIMKTAGDHPNILKLLDYREEENVVLVVSERCLCTFEDIFRGDQQHVWQEMISELGEVGTVGMKNNNNNRNNQNN